MKRLLKLTILLYTFGAFFAMTMLRPVSAIVVVVPIIFGLPLVLGWVIGLASLPVTIISIFVNVDSYKTSKKRFLLFALATWVVIISIIAGITVLVYQIRQ